MQNTARRVLGIAVAIAGIGWSVALAKGLFLPELSDAARWGFALAVGAYGVLRAVLAFVRKPAS